MMGTPDGHGRLELTKFHTPTAVSAQPENAPANTLGIRRVMFAVDDIEDVLARLDGRLQGNHRTVHRGSGTDFVGLREYLEGDDARHIDWNVSARLDEPHVRVFIEDRDLTVWLVLDRSASMAVGAPGRGKHEVLAELALVLARLFGRGGNRVGAVLYDTGSVRVVPPGASRRHALLIGAELERASGERGKKFTDTTDLAAMLNTLPGWRHAVGAW